MAAIKAVGNSAEWNTQKSNMVRIVNIFIAQDEEALAAGKDWSALGEQMLCSQLFYQRLAHYLLNVYVFHGPKAEPGGSHLEGRVASNYLRTIINMAAERFKANGQAETKLFFNCLDTSSSDEAKWLKRVQTNMQRDWFEASRKAGKVLDKSTSKSATCLPGATHLS